MGNIQDELDEDTCPFEQCEYGHSPSQTCEEVADEYAQDYVDDLAFEKARGN